MRPINLQIWQDNSSGVESVRLRRILCGISQTELANLAGVSRDWVAARERGTTSIKPEEITALHAALDQRERR
ncbi:MAG TPA: helix-turn-helix transcriptional regulator [Gallionellaceae bacterium]|nr:helix-turn-helix transcriptional regulator [Gallionellaceae bacterium]